MARHGPTGSAVAPLSWAWHRPSAGLADAGPQPGVPELFWSFGPPSPAPVLLPLCIYLALHLCPFSPRFSGSAPRFHPLDHFCHLSLQTVVSRTGHMLVLGTRRREAEFRPTSFGVLTFTQVGRRCVCGCSEDLGTSVGNGASVHETGGPQEVLGDVFFPGGSAVKNLPAVQEL